MACEENFEHILHGELALIVHTPMVFGPNLHVRFPGDFHCNLGSIVKLVTVGFIEAIY